MMTLQETMTELKALGNENIKKVLLKHGIVEPLFGVKVEHLKVIQKRVKMDYDLSNALYLTPNADAMYLAGLIADDAKMTKQDLQAWVKLAISKNISDYTVPWVAAGSKYGFELALEWIDSPEQHIAAAGWCTLSGLAALKPDHELDLPAIKILLNQIEERLPNATSRERSAMNGFIIAVGTYIKGLTNDAMATAVKVGTLTRDKDGTASKVPDAIENIKKTMDKNLIGKKKKTIKC